MRVKSEGKMEYWEKQCQNIFNVQNEVEATVLENL